MAPEVELRDEVIEVEIEVTDGQRIAQHLAQVVAAHYGNAGFFPRQEYRDGNKSRAGDNVDEDVAQAVHDAQ